MDTIARIRAEIERLIQESDFDESANLHGLLSFLDTLEKPEEKDEDVYSVNEAMQKFIKDGETDVEQERRFRAYKAFWDAMDTDEEPVSEEIEEAAENCVWKSIDSNDTTLVPKFIPLLLSLFISGAYWQKEQMMKEAVEYDVHELYIDESGYHCYVSLGTEYQPGDKVKLIIVKEDGK